MRIEYDYYNLMHVYFSVKLIGVDVIAALDMYVEQGQWDKCIQEAEQQVIIGCIRLCKVLSERLDELLFCLIGFS